MAGQAQPFAQRSLPQQAQMPQQTLAMLTNRFSNFAPGMPAAMPQNAPMMPAVMPQGIPDMMPQMPAGIMPSQSAMQNAAAAANLIGRFPIAGQMPNQMPNSMAFQNANPMANLATRFPGNV